MGGVWWASGLWYLLHAILRFVLILRLLYLKFSRFFAHHPPSSIRNPTSVAVVIDPDSARNDKEKIPKLLLWLAAAGVRHVALYDMEGILKSSRSYLKERVLSAQKLHHLGFSFSPSCIGHARKVEETFVELLSVRDGKAAIAETAQNALRSLRSLPRQEQQRRVEELCEEDVNRYLNETQQQSPDPELMLVFGSTNCVHGFPPWRLKLTEIVHLGAFKELNHRLVISAMQIYSGKTQRYGR